MIFETHTQQPPLSDFIESVFHFKDFVPDHSIERVVPTGQTFVLFELDGLERHTYNNDTLEPTANFSGAWVSGTHQNYLSISAHQNSEMFVIQFKSVGAYPFLHIKMDEMADQVVPASELIGGQLISIRNELLAASSSQEKFQVADKWLASRFDQTLVPPVEIVEVVELLRQEPAAKLKEIINSFDGSQKHLISQFKKFVGLTPKQFQRVLRFNDVFVKMQSEQSLSWSDIAYQCGYSDQSHFIREFKQYSGFNPETFLAREYDAHTPNFFPLDRDG